MAISLSPAVIVTERDLTLIAPAIATSAAGLAAAFAWGPVLERVLIDNENLLVERFGRPDDDTFIGFFSAANFLSYGRDLRVVRVIGEEAFNASTSPDHVSETFDGTGANANFQLTATFTTEPDLITVVVDGVVQVEGAGNDYQLTYTAGPDTLDIDFEAGSIPGVGTDNIVVYVNAPQIGNEDVFQITTGIQASFIGKYPGELVNGVRIVAATAANWSSLASTDQDIFLGEPVGDEINIAVVDETGQVSGLGSTILERYDYLQTTPGATKSDGTSNYYVDVLNDVSSWIWSTGNLDDLSIAGDVTLGNGQDDNNPTDGAKTFGYDLFANADEVDVSLIIGADASEAVAEHLIDIATNRKTLLHLEMFYQAHLTQFLMVTGNTNTTDTMTHIVGFQ
jgi:hypothetical protein